MQCIGVLLEEQGKLKETESYYQRFLEGRERTLERDRLITLVAVSNTDSLLPSQRQAQPRRALLSLRS